MIPLRPQVDLMVVLGAVVEHDIPRAIVLEAVTVLLVSDVPMVVIADLSALPTYALQVRPRRAPAVVASPVTQAVCVPTAGGSAVPARCADRQRRAPWRARAPGVAAAVSRVARAVRVPCGRVRGTRARRGRRERRSTSARHV